MSARTWVDGVACDQVPADDRGLRYGDGVFETIAVRDARPVALDRHLARLARGCDVLGLTMPDPATLDADLQAMALPERAVVRLTVTRGSGGRGYTPDNAAAARRIWELHDWPLFEPRIYRDGMRVVWLETTLSRQPALAGLKHLGRLEQVLAARELERSDAHDGLLCDTRGQVIEAVSANVFARSGTTLSTPALDQCGVAGIVRERVLAQARTLGFATCVKPMGCADFLQADEVFLTSSIRGIVPVRRLDAVALSDFSSARAFQALFSTGDGTSK